MILMGRDFKACFISMSVLEELPIYMKINLSRKFSIRMSSSLGIYLNVIESKSSLRFSLI